MRKIRDRKLGKLFAEYLENHDIDDQIDFLEKIALEINDYEYDSTESKIVYVTPWETYYFLTDYNTVYTERDYIRGPSRR